MTSSGIVKVPFVDLSPQLQARYHYDAKAAAAFADRLSAANRALKANVAAAQSQIQQERAEQAAKDEAQKKAAAEKNLIAQRIARHEAWIGMTLEQASQAMGLPPDQVNRTVTNHGVVLEWVFTNGMRFTFENGILTSFEESMPAAR